MATFELILFLLVAVVASSILERFLPRVSLPLVQIALGAAIALAVTTPLEWGLDPELLLILFIAPLHFNESRHVDSGELWRNRWGIASLSVGLVFAIALALGATLHGLMPAVPLAGALALGAAMGSTDAVAVTGLTHDRRFGKRHEALLKGEALFNDVTGTVVFQCCVAVVASGAFSLAHAGEEFALDLFGGLAGGFIMGIAAWALLGLLRRADLDSPTLHVMLELLIPFIIYLAAKSLHIGAVIAVVASGLAMSLLPQKHTAAMARMRLQAKSVWDTLEFVLNGIIFVILGMQLPRLLKPATDGGSGDPLTILGVVAALTLILEAVRFLWLLAMDLHAAKLDGRPLRSCFRRTALKSTLAMTFAGAKGGVTLSLMLTMPVVAGAEAFPHRELLISVASGMILGTLVLANFAVPLLAPSKHCHKKSKERVDAEIDIVMAVIDSIQKDAPDTGSVRGGEGDDVDEPATVIVMKRYADVLKDLAAHGSREKAALASAEVKRVDGLYGRVEEIAGQVVGYSDEYYSDGDGADPDGNADIADSVDRFAVPNGPADTFRALRGIYDAVEDVQAQALNRELQIIKAMKNEGAISAIHAKELRNDVYVQQLMLD